MDGDTVAENDGQAEARAGASGGVATLQTQADRRVSHSERNASRLAVLEW